MRKLTLDELCDQILSIKDPLLVMHTRPDGDTVGSTIALAQIFRMLGKFPYCISPDPIPKRLAFLCKDADLFSTDLPDMQFTVITLDVASLGQLGRLREQLMGDLHPALMIDHHERGEAYADHYVRASAAAVGEIIFDLAKRMLERGMLGSLPIELLSPIYAAISSDTGCFKYSNTTPHTHAIAGELISYGVDAAEINRLLFDVKSAEQLRAEGFVQSNLKRHPSGRIAWITITRELRESLGLLDEHFETAIDVVRSLEGVEIAIAIKESPDGRFKASLRSTGIDVASIAASLGGGGHIRAAGCSLTAANAEEAAETVVKQAWQAFKSGEST